MQRYVLVNDTSGLVENVTLWDGGKSWSVPKGYQAIQSDTANIGDTYSNGVFSSPSAPSPKLADVQNSKLTELRSACAAEIVGGFSSSALGSAHSYPSQPTDQTNLIGAVTASQSPNLATGWSINFWCADSSGAWSMRPHTAAQIQQVLADGVTARSACSAQLDTLTQQVMAATTVSAVQAISWTPAV